jgi:hypothetical protein
VRERVAEGRVRVVRALHWEEKESSMKIKKRKALDPDYSWKRDKTLSLKQRISEARHDLHDAMIASNEVLPDSLVSAWAALDLLLGTLLPRKRRRFTIQ